MTSSFADLAGPNCLIWRSDASCLVVWLAPLSPVLGTLFVVFLPNLYLPLVSSRFSGYARAIFPPVRTHTHCTHRRSITVSFPNYSCLRSHCNFERYAVVCHSWLPETSDNWVGVVIVAPCSSLPPLSGITISLYAKRTVQTDIFIGRQEIICEARGGPSIPSKSYPCAR
jgi:hypothetical protein